MKIFFKDEKMYKKYTIFLKIILHVFILIRKIYKVIIRSLIIFLHFLLTILYNKKFILYNKITVSI